MNNKRLKELLEKNNITQAELSENIGVSQAFISYVLQGFKTPSIEVMKRIAEFLHVTIDELV